jgi:hypothetical protein
MCDKKMEIIIRNNSNYKIYYNGKCNSASSIYHRKILIIKPKYSAPMYLSFQESP